jgi:D-amino-acid oxidase
VSVKGTEAADWDRNTWEPLADLARNHPEAGVHFQSTEIYNRGKDVSSTTAAWFSELLSPNPWFMTVVEDVSACTTLTTVGKIIPD